MYERESEKKDEKREIKREQKIKIEKDNRRWVLND